MEKGLDDCEFWLPPQFLTDDDLLMDFKTLPVVGEDGKHGNSPFSYGFNPFGCQSDLNSPVESLAASTETESDEDDYVSGLTRKMASSTMHDDIPKGWSLSGSPQSTLCGCKQGSSRGSPNGPSQASSPPRISRADVSIDLLYAAAGEVARIRMMEESAGAGLYHNKAGIWAPPPRKTSPVPIGPKNTNQPPLSYQQLQVAQFLRLKQQQMLKQGGFRQYPLNQNQQQRSGNGAAVGRASLNLSNTAWPTLQQSQQQQQTSVTSSGMRAVFLGNPGPKRECAGTGVFLPRRIGAQNEPTRKKPGCPVILPERVVHALNLNLEAMDAAARPHPQVQSRCQNGDVGFTPHISDGGLKYRNNMVVAQQRRNQRPQPVALPQELQLPQEWTY